MVQAWKVLTFTTLATLVGVGCGPVLDRPLVRAQLGANARRIAMPAPASSRPNTVARSTQIQTQPAGAEPQLSDNAYTGNLQFSVRPVGYLYFGGEVEAGAFARQGSNYGGAYGVIGLEGGGARAWISLEVAAGRQWIRWDLESKDIGTNIVEPRVRGHLMLNPQISLGAMVGATAVPEERGWAAGLFMGFYSDPVDGSSPAID